MSHTSRIVLLIDMDCFYCQVEENLDPTLKGKPLAVVQYNQWRGGGIIAVNYPARDRGVTRHMRGDDAREKCPEIVLARVPQVRGKADLSKYREAGKKVAEVLQTFTPCLERASVDEAYLDITHIVDKRIEDGTDEVSISKLQNTFVVGSSTNDFIENVTTNREYNESNFKLALGGVVAEEIREAVLQVAGYKCSAGVAHNKILAKLVCGLHKPNRQTILPQEAVEELYKDMPIKKIQGLGGKFGNIVMEKLCVNNMAELAQFSLKELSKKFDEKAATWLYNLARGIDIEPVNTRLISKSIGCCKKFPGISALCVKEDVEHWLNELAEEIAERLEKDLEENGRKARQMVVSFAHEVNDDEISGSKTHPLNSYEQKKIFENACKIVQKNCLKEDGSYRVVFLGISVGNFQDMSKVKEITSFFKNMEARVKKPVSVTTVKDDESDNTSTNSSIYSATTEEGDDVTEENLIFYHQIHPESIANQHWFDDTAKDVEHDCDKSNKEASDAAKNSFFTKYFNSDNHNNANKLVATATIEAAPPNDLICSECAKTFSDPLDFQSHLDYHFAISLVKNEAHLYKNELKTSTSPVQTSAGKKRKKEASTSGHKPIANYFKQTEGLTEDKELCEVCQKYIDIDQKEVHLDYHTAKKLHLEINSSENRRTDTSKVVAKGRKSAKNELKGQTNILGFFKPS